MKILNPYRFLKGKGGSGAKSGEDPKLVPPREQSLRKSISLTETIDILCEGPIYGLVDQFGRKVYGLDMLKGVYLNGIPIMNNKGEYNFRNILMEINLGTENQKPLPSFKNVNIPKGSGFRLLGPIKAFDDAEESKLNNRAGGNFVNWAKRGDWPSENKDPFVFVHKIKNKDVKKIKISLLVEALSDTVDVKERIVGKPERNDIGTTKGTAMTLFLTYGLENSHTVKSRTIIIGGTAVSPFAIMIGDSESGEDATILSSAARIAIGGTISNGYSSVTPSGGGSRNQSNALGGYNENRDKDPRLLE
jgi:hypothetical protein